MGSGTQSQDTAEPSPNAYPLHMASLCHPSPACPEHLHRCRLYPPCSKVLFPPKDPPSQSVLMRSHLSRQPVQTPPLRSADASCLDRLRPGHGPPLPQHSPIIAILLRAAQGPGHFVFNSAAPRPSESTYA